MPPKAKITEDQIVAAALKPEPRISMPELWPRS